MNRKEFAKQALMASAMLSVPSVFRSKINEAADPILTDDWVPAWKSLFNGRDLTNFVDMNTSEDTWYVEDGILKCTGEPIGVMRTEKQYENFILDIEYRHMEPGGNSGVFVWADGEPFEDRPFPTGMEVQMLDPQIAEIRNVTEDFAHGQLFPVMGLENTVPDNEFEQMPSRSNPLERRVKGVGEWNRYIVVCVDGTIKLSVNGRFVNGMRSYNRKKGYICPEAEGYEVHFRKIDIMELPGSVITEDQIAPKVG
ncbi:MAG: DUF1080 domain-containing protein [Balneolaceae bacterium]|nr:DUF1080 domain-containing protein [Balneolaceae bacterium]